MSKPMYCIFKVRHIYTPDNRKAFQAKVDVCLPCLPAEHLLHPAFRANDFFCGRALSNCWGEWHGDLPEYRQCTESVYGENWQAVREEIELFIQGRTAELRAIYQFNKQAVAEQPIDHDRYVTFADTLPAAAKDELPF